MNQIKRKITNLKLNTKIIIAIFLLTTIVNIISILSNGFADFYRNNIFPYISNCLSHITNLYKYSLGEILICLGIVALLIGIVILILSAIRVKSVKNIRKYYFIFVIYCLSYIYVTETFNCFIMYRADTIEESMFNDNQIQTSEEKDIEKLLEVYNDVVDNINKLYENVKRDENNELIEDFTIEECKEAMRNVSVDFPLLEGYYPNPKKIYYSNIMTQQYLQGIYFPFSMEANYNKLMYPSNLPSTICHEFSHLKGYIREDEANFISYVACTKSDNNFIKYSGYLSVYYYLLNDIMDYGNEDIWQRMNPIYSEAIDDNIFVKSEIFDEIEDDSIISTETMSNATDKFLDTNLKMNGIKSGMNNYNEVVKLLILYHFSAWR